MPITRELVARQLGTGTIRRDGIGMTAYPRFLTPVAERLAEGGRWTITKRFGSYALALPDNGSLPRVKLPVPETDELLKLAEDLHKTGISYEGWMWNWPLRYEPGDYGRIVSPVETRREMPARLDIGIAGLWRAVVTWPVRRDGVAEVWVDRRCFARQRR